MPAHLKKRADRGGVWYLFDGSYKRSLETTKKGLAEFKLEQYIREKNMPKPISTPTVREYFNKWIDGKVEPLNRRAQIRDYRQHFNCYILPEFGDVLLSDISTKNLNPFRVKLLQKVSLKTARNIISSFRAFYRGARADYEDALRDKDPFVLIEWPRTQPERPDPFTAEERDRIVEYWKQNDFFYFPWVFTLFHTGMRPSEASALKWTDVDLEGGKIEISKSRYMGTESAPKTSASNRAIEIDEDILQVLKVLPSRELGIQSVFVNKYGDPINAKKWSEHYWAGALEELGIRHRKFYATRHTFITQAIRRGENLLAVAQYCGTSLSMIQKDYCGTLSLQLGTANRPKIDPQAKKLNEVAVESTVQRPGPPAANTDSHLLKFNDFKGFRKRKSA